MDETNEVDDASRRATEKGPAIRRTSDELTLDAIAEKLGLTYDEAVSALVRAKHKPPEAP